MQHHCTCQWYASRQRRTSAKPSAARIMAPYFLPRSLGTLPSAGRPGRPLASVMLVPRLSWAAVSLAMTACAGMLWAQCQQLWLAAGMRCDAM